ncbi:hypothetical protein HTG_18200 [Natrinema mahii]|nr:hypothetical protein HTG_18200 [Natrinema mahii]
MSASLHDRAQPGGDRFELLLAIEADYGQRPRVSFASAIRDSATT